MILIFKNQIQKFFPNTYIVGFLKIYIFIYFLFLAVLGLCCCMRAFSSCGEQGLLIAVASLVVEHRL